MLNLTKAKARLFSKALALLVFCATNAQADSFIKFSIDGQTYGRETEIGQDLYDNFLDKNDKQILEALVKQCKAMGADSFETCGFRVAGEAVLSKAQRKYSQSKSEVKSPPLSSSQPTAEQNLVASTAVPTQIEGATDNENIKPLIPNPDYVGNPPKLAVLSKAIRVHLVVADILDQVCLERVKIARRVLGDYAKMYGTLGLRDLLEEARVNPLYIRTKRLAESAIERNPDTCLEMRSAYKQKVDLITKQIDTGGASFEAAYGNGILMPHGVLPIVKATAELTQEAQQKREDSIKEKLTKLELATESHLKEREKQLEKQQEIIARYGEYGVQLSDELSFKISQKVNQNHLIISDPGQIKVTFSLLEAGKFPTYINVLARPDKYSVNLKEAEIALKAAFLTCITTLGNQCEKLEKYREGLKKRLVTGFLLELEKQIELADTKAKIDEENNQKKAVKSISNKLVPVYRSIQHLQGLCG
ncbi:hypothetical protein N9I56_05315, partial [Alphaproteobacteria bacterium]|nr:hypothetical protein [Alphaproteobacteria bacterium]